MWLLFQSHPFWRNGVPSVLEIRESAAAWCLSWGSVKTFWPQNLCIPGLVRIPNHTVMEALTYCTLFSLWLSCHSRCWKKVKLLPLPLALLSVTGSTILASVPVYTMCPDWSPGSLTPPVLSALQADLKNIRLANIRPVNVTFAL